MFSIRKFKKDESGQIGVIFALAAVPLMALTSAAIDYSQLSKERNAVSSALDAAVLAAANNNAIADAEKGIYAQTHFSANYQGDMQLTLSPSVTSDHVRLVAEGTLNLTFGNVVGIDDLDLLEASAATLKTEYTICVLSLSKDADAAISFDDDIAFTATQCSVHANSESVSAISAMTRGAAPMATSFCAVGGVQGQVEPHSKGECSPVADPYVAVPPAEIGVCKSEFLVESIVPDSAPATPDDAEQTSGSDEADSRLRDLIPAHLDPEFFSDGVLPSESPIPVQALIQEFVSRNAEELFLASTTALAPGDESSADQAIAIAELATLSGNDFQLLLAAYDDFGGALNCRDNPLRSSCHGFRNPYLTTAPEDVPSHSLVADIFDIAFGFYLEEEEPEEQLPDIVVDGTVELINGQLYSRNNIDNELIPVSANLSGGNVVLTPGTYCGGLTVDGLSVRFTEGDYIFKDGPLTFLNNSQAKADRVTFGFTGTGATLNIESGSSLSIRSATTGPRAGLAFMQMVDVSAPGNREAVEAVNRISSGGSVSMSGTAYFPQQTLMISGEDTHLGANSPAVGLIADKVQFRGQRGSRVAIGVDHVKAGIPPIQPQADDGVRLVE